MELLLCIRCSKTNVHVARDMKATRVCGTCGAVWLPKDDLTLKPKKEKPVRRELTKEEAEIVCYKADAEGFDYCFTDYSSWDELKDTEIYPEIEAYQKASEDLKEKLEKYREKFDIEEA